MLIKKNNLNALCKIISLKYLGLSNNQKEKIDIRSKNRLKPNSKVCSIESNTELNR